MSKPDDAKGDHLSDDDDVFNETILVTPRPAAPTTRASLSRTTNGYSDKKKDKRTLSQKIADAARMGTL